MSDSYSIGWIDINEDGLAIVTEDGVSERAKPPPIDLSILDDLPTGSITVTGFWEA